MVCLDVVPKKSKHTDTTHGHSAKRIGGVSLVHPWLGRGAFCFWHLCMPLNLAHSLKCVSVWFFGPCPKDAAEISLKADYRDFGAPNGIRINSPRIPQPLTKKSKSSATLYQLNHPGSGNYFVTPNGRLTATDSLLKPPASWPQDYVQSFDRQSSFWCSWCRRSRLVNMHACPGPSSRGVGRLSVDWSGVGARRPYRVQLFMRFIQNLSRCLV